MERTRFSETGGVFMSAAAYRLSAAFVFVGFSASAVSTYVHARIFNDPTYVSFCDVNSTLSCTQVYLSQYGSIGGVPVAYLGLVWFMFAGALILVARRATSMFRAHLPAYLFLLSTLALAVVLYLAYTSFIVLGTICMLCVAVYVAVLGLFIVSGASTSNSMSQVPGLVMADIRILEGFPIGFGLMVALVIGSVLGGVWLRTSTVQGVTATAPATLSVVEREEFLGWWSSQPRVDLPIANEDAEVLVVKFNDYMCPPCQQTYLNYQSVFAKYQATRPGAVRLVIKHYPLDPECNQAVPNGIHYASCEAAVAVLLAGRGGEEKVRALEDWLFEHQATLSVSSVQAAARDIGGVDDFEAEYSSMLEQVRDDIALGVSLGVEATPTFVINGVRVTGGLTVQYFDAAISFELERAGVTQ